MRKQAGPNQDIFNQPNDGNPVKAMTYTNLIEQGKELYRPGGYARTTSHWYTTNTIP